jgi:hypothetical protein
MPKEQTKGHQFLRQEPQRSKDMANIALAPCVSKKCSFRTKAENMYRSALFKKNLEYAKGILKADKIFILSAKYRLLPLDKEICPYNVTLKNMGSEEKQIWAEAVVQQLRDECDIPHDKFYILAGKDYYKDLIPYLQNYEIKMEGQKIGKRLQWLNAQLLQGGN